MKKNTNEPDYLARLVIYDLPDMTPRQKEGLIKWLESILKEFKREKKDYKIFARRYIARLYSSSK